MEDADFLSLLQEIERTDVTLDGLQHGDSSDLLDVFLPDSETQKTTYDGEERGDEAAALASPSMSHVERCRLNRKRKKHELEELRSAATSLESTLARLTQPASNDVIACSSSWREVSRRALIERRNALAENKRLREMLAKQWMAAHSIQAALWAAPLDQPPGFLRAEEARGRSLTRPRDATAPVSSRDLYHELFQNIHAAYEQHTSEQELAKFPIGVRKLSMEMVSLSDGTTDMSIIVKECQQLPLSFSFISNATWTHLSTPCLSSSNPESHTTHTCGRTALTCVGDDLFGECGAACSPPSAMDALPLTPGRLAIRRYIESKRLTFVWECDGCYQCDGASNPIGRVTERGWCTIEPSADRANASMFRIQVQYVPHTLASGTTTCCAPRTELASSMALALYRETIARTFGAVEREVFKDTKSNARSTHQKCR